MAPNERRRFPRIKPKDLASHFRAGARISLAAVVESVSMSGAFIQTADPPPIGTPLALSLVRPGPTPPINLTGRVVSVLLAYEAAARSAAPGMEVEFDPLPPQVEALLQGLLASLSGPAPEAALNPTEIDSSRREVFDFSFNAEASPTPPPPASPPPPQPMRPVAADAPRLMAQVRGLLMQLGEAQSELVQRARELEALRDELQRLRVDVDEKNRRLRELTAESFA